jgi:uncharacterized surface anchored protein
MRPLLALIVGTATLFAQSSQKTRFGEIKGTVLDQNKKTVPSATVYAVRHDALLDDVTSRSVTTDSNGKFHFHGVLELGSYKLYAQKDADGYLSPLDAFYADSQDRQVDVTLSSKHPSSTVRLNLGMQAAVISGKVFDVDSGSPLKAYVGLMDEEGNGHSIVVDGDYKLVVPSEKSFQLMVTVIGTRRPLIPVSSLRLDPGQHIYMDIPITASEK